jgi:hypothetical protein
MRVTYSECVFVALVIQYTLLLRLIILSVASPALQYFFTLSHKRHDFRKKLIRHEYVFGFSLKLLSETIFTKKN